MPSKSRDRPWFIAALAMVIVLTVGVRIGRDVATLRPRFDEPWIRAPIETIVRDGWSVRTAIDFEETKGPAMVWPYALFGQFVGGGLGDLRLATMVFFVVGTALLLAIARRAGVHGPGLLAVALLHCLVPQQLVLSQLVMSEAIFVATVLAMILVFLRGFERRDGGSGCSIAAPVLFGLLLSVALHNRVHAVAFAAACALVAVQRDRLRAWPWVAALLLAGLSRVPLMLRWEGLVSPKYREMHQLGGGSASLLQCSNATYLLAALLPWTAVFLWPAWRGEAAGRGMSPDDRAAGRRWIVVAAVMGLLLAWVAPPLLASRLPAPSDWQVRAPDGLSRYLGPAATIARLGGASIAVQGAVLGVLAAIGSASLGAIAVLSWRRQRADRGHATEATEEHILGRLTFWTLVSGIALYVTTQSFVLDRYILPWAALVPILWWRWLPRWLVALMAVALAALAAQGVVRWLS